MLQTLMELVGDCSPKVCNSPTFPECTLLQPVESNTYALGSFFQREIRRSPWDPLEPGLTGTGPEAPPSFASTPGHACTTTCPPPTCWALSRSAVARPSRPGPFPPPRSQPGRGTTRQPRTAHPRPGEPCCRSGPAPLRAGLGLSHLRAAPPVFPATCPRPRAGGQPHDSSGSERARTERSGYLADGPASDPVRALSRFRATRWPTARTSACRAPTAAAPPFAAP